MLACLRGYRGLAAICRLHHVRTVAVYINKSWGRKTRRGNDEDGRIKARKGKEKDLTGQKEKKGAPLCPLGDRDYSWSRASLYRINLEPLEQNIYLLIRHESGKREERLMWVLVELKGSD